MVGEEIGRETVRRLFRKIGWKERERDGKETRNVDSRNLLVYFPVGCRVFKDGIRGQIFVNCDRPKFSSFLCVPISHAFHGKA